MRLNRFVATAALASAGVVASAQPFDGIYSDVRRTDEGHEGAEVVISSGSPDQYWAVIRCADYKLGTPVRLRAVVKGNQIEIAADPSGQSLCPNGKFVGRFSGAGITGQFRDLSLLPSSWAVHKLGHQRATRQ